MTNTIIRAWIFLVLLTSVYTKSLAQLNELAKAIDGKKFNPSTLLWYTAPALKWEEALPVGNGRLGAMVFGKTDEEVIQLNEDTYWTGGPYESDVKDGYKKLGEIQQLVFHEDMQKAQDLFGRNLMGYPVEQQKYQSLASLHLFFNETDTTHYKRWLDISTGISSVEYESHSVVYHRDVFSSFPDQVIVIRLTASKPGQISFSANLRGVRNQAHSNYGTDYFRMDGDGQDGLTLTGKSADYLGIPGKLKYKAVLKALPEGGRMVVDGKTLTIENANAVTLYILAATNFVNYKDVSGDPTARIIESLQQLNKKEYTELLAAHLSDYKKLMDRVSMNFPATENSWLPTDERLKKIQETPDPPLTALCYQFGRYVLVSSSRPGSQAANLQGIWNNDMNPAWDSKYTTNINLQMNYWAVESGNLSECASPLFKLMQEISDQGTKVAREHYGARGWVLHQNTDIWRVAAPMDGSTWGTFTVGGAWLVNELWEHYRYTKDEVFLQEFYPLIKGSVDFFMDFLIEHPNGKWLVTNPSTSPENFPASKGNGPYFDEVTGSMLPGTTICAGSTVDMQILTDLFSNYMAASKLVGKDADFAAKVAVAKSRLVPPQIGKDGALQEWTDDWGQLEKNHRHASHMYGLYPGNVLSMNHTPQFMDACRNVLNQRGDGGAGWSRAWKVNLWSRLYDGNRAYQVFKGYLKEQCLPQLFAKCFTPMQVDGTLGLTAGISEMLVQSHEGLIDILPALPDELPEGWLTGIRTRGAFELNFSWKAKKLQSLSVLSGKGGVCRIHTKTKVSRVSSGTKNISYKKLPGDIIQFNTTEGYSYSLEF